MYMIHIVIYYGRTPICSVYATTAISKPMINIVFVYALCSIHTGYVHDYTGVGILICVCYVYDYTGVGVLICVCYVYDYTCIIMRYMYAMCDICV